jgi:hypothetical protein
MVSVTIFCPNPAQILRIGLVQNLRAVPLLDLNWYTVNVYQVQQQEQVRTSKGLPRSFFRMHLT